MSNVLKTHQKVQYIPSWGVILGLQMLTIYHKSLFNDGFKAHPAMTPTSFTNPGSTSILSHRDEHLGPG